MRVRRPRKGLWVLRGRGSLGIREVDAVGRISFYWGHGLSRYTGHLIRRTSLQEKESPTLGLGRPPLTCSNTLTTKRVGTYGRTTSGRKKRPRQKKKPVNAPARSDRRAATINGHRT